MRARLLVLPLACAALVAGCGGGDDPADTTGSTATGAEPSGVGGPGVTVAMQDFRFQPRTIRILVGEEVTWRNDGATGHTVAGRGVPDPPTSGGVEPGDTYTWRARQAGTVDYICEVHPNMTGRVIVEP
jgi:plastocyanin